MFKEGRREMCDLHIDDAASYLLASQRDSTRAASFETLLWHKAGSLDAKKPHQ